MLSISTSNGTAMYRHFTDIVRLPVLKAAEAELPSLNQTYIIRYLQYTSNKQSIPVINQ